MFIEKIQPKYLNKKSNVKMFCFSLSAAAVR